MSHPKSSSSSSSSSASSPLDVNAIRSPMFQVHSSKAHMTLNWRIQQLQLLKFAFRKHRDEFVDALQQDLGKSYHEALVTEIVIVENELDLFLSNLKNWIMPEVVPSPGYLMPCFSEIRFVPLVEPGCLIIGPSNYPLMLCFTPALASLAGGNPTVVKPSELCPATSRIIKTVVDKYFDPGALQVIEGGVPETTALLRESWGKVFFTGSERIGRIVAKAAAETLTPVVLELGGKSPVYVDETSNCPPLPVIANRIMWGKTLNAGQSCVGPDYLLCHESQKDKLCQALVVALEGMFGKEPHLNGEFPRIVSPRHAARHVELLKEAEAHGQTQVLCGGSKLCGAGSNSSNASQPKKHDQYVAPTVLVNPPLEARLWKEEIFGPILLIRTVSSKEEAIEFINHMPGTPLAMYVFTLSAKVYETFLQYCPAAGAVRNDCIIGFGSPFLPVGGLGTSGYGNYHGKHSFHCFTHQMYSIFKPSRAAFEFFGARYHPMENKRGQIFAALLRIPSIPVLHTQKLLVLCMILFILVSGYCPAVITNGLADILGSMAAWLRK